MISISTLVLALLASIAMTLLVATSARTGICPDSAMYAVKSVLPQSAATRIRIAARTVTPAEDYADHVFAWQMAFADNESDYAKRQQMYAEADAPYSHRLFAHDMLADNEIAAAAASFLALEGPLWKDSPAARLLPEKIANAIHRRIYGVDAIEIPAGAGLYGVLEDLSRIWFAAGGENGAFSNFDVWMLADKQATIRAYRKAVDAGVVPMLQAWQAGVPLADIIA